MKKLMLLILALVLVMGSTLVNAQQMNVTLPAKSQKANVMQRIGLTDISISYSSPAVKKREVWGKLVPYDKIWRAGADANTTISFSTDVTINGQTLGKGTYGLFMVPGQSEWELIFSKNHSSWGHYFYKKEEDALRVKVKPVEAPFHREWLAFDFTERQGESTIAALHWAKLKVPFKIGVDVKKTVVASLRKELRSTPWWQWQGTFNAAKFCYDNNTNHEEALKWTEQSIARKENFQNLMLKSQLLTKLGKTAEAEKTKAHAIKIGTEQDMTQHAYSMAMAGDPKACITQLNENIKRFKTWSSYRAMARYYNYFKDKENAKKYYKLALKKVPADKKEGLEKEIKQAG